jgi:hypothetical protein
MNISELSAAGFVRGPSHAESPPARRSVDRNAAGSQSSPATSRISASAKLLARAARGLNPEQEVRPAAVAAAREQLRNWQTPGQASLGEIAEGLLADLA